MAFDEVGDLHVQTNPAATRTLRRSSRWLGNDCQKGAPRSKRVRGGFVLEAAAIYVVLYPVFTWARGFVVPSAAAALSNAERLIGWEQSLGIYYEVDIQQFFLPHRWFIGFWNVWYGSVHFAAPIVAFVVLYRRDPLRYVRWRNTYLLMLLPILLGFWLFPLMPPGLLPSGYGYVETRLAYFTIGKPVPHSGESMFLYAAMPSMHIAFATWVTLALWPLARTRLARLALASYPALMIFSTVVTASHYFLDAVGAWLALAVGYSLASWRTWWPGWKSRRMELAASEQPRLDAVHSERPEP